MSTSEPPWDLYGTLLAVLQEGSLSAAARSLNLAQPTVRRQIEQLEEGLGVVLFTRSINGLVPTELALSALPYAESIAATARALRRTLTAPEGELRGTVRVTSSEMLAVEVLPAILTALRARHPELHIELAATNRAEDLLRREADVAVRTFEPTQAALVRRRAGRVALGLFAHERYLAAHPAPTSIRDLTRGHALVGADRGRALLDALTAFGAQLSARDFAFRCDSDAAQLAAVRAGMGIGGCQIPLSRSPVPLVRILPKLTASLDLWVVMHEDLRSSARVRAVFDHLVARLEVYASSAT
jgi:DNA-binding transcriptional LysR family regulator